MPAYQALMHAPLLGVTGTTSVCSTRAHGEAPGSPVHVLPEYAPFALNNSQAKLPAKTGGNAAAPHGATVVSTTRTYGQSPVPGIGQPGQYVPDGGMNAPAAVVTVQPAGAPQTGPDSNPVLTQADAGETAKTANAAGAKRRGRFSIDSEKVAPDLPFAPSKTGSRQVVGFARNGTIRTVLGGFGAWRAGLSGWVRADGPRGSKEHWESRL